MELPWLATTEFFCPVVGRRATVEFLTYDGRHPVGVVTCSAFADQTAFPCGTRCVTAKFREASWLTSTDQVC